MEEMEGSLVDAAMSGIDIAHCVSADFAIGAGVARQLDIAFHLRDELRTIPAEQRKVGNVVEVRRLAADGRTAISIYNLITKTMARDLPTYESFGNAVRALRQACSGEIIADRKRPVLGIPRMGCGLDRLEWSHVKDIILRTFDDSGVPLIVYTPPPS